MRFKFSTFLPFMLLALVLTGCPAEEESSPETMIDTTGLSKDCSSDEECVGVFIGNVCGCGCVVDVLSTAAFDEFRDRRDEALSQCSRILDCFACPDDHVVSCSEAGRCVIDQDVGAGGSGGSGGSGGAGGAGGGEMVDGCTAGPAPELDIGAHPEEPFAANDPVSLSVGGQGGGARFNIALGLKYAPETAIVQVRIVDANDPVQAYAENVFMAQLDCENDARPIWVPGLSFNGDAFGLINREVTVSAAIAFEYQGEQIVVMAEHTGPIEVQ